MSIFCPRCITKHPQRECPLNNISVCHICIEENPTYNFPSFLVLQDIYKSGDVAQTSRRPPWQLRDQPSYPNFPPQPPLYYPPYQPPQQWNNSSWQNWPPQYPPPQFHNSNICHKDGEDNHILSHNLSMHLITFILRIKQISSKCCLDLYLQFLLSHNKFITFRMQILLDQHYYLHS